MTLDPRIAQAFAAAHGFALEPHLVVLAQVGSHSQGIHVPRAAAGGGDDVDWLGSVVPPLDHHLGLPRWTHWELRQDELDVVLYSVDKTFRLLLQGNPNVLVVLWLREQDYAYRQDAFAQWHAQRDLFATQAAADAFIGYASSQLARLTAFDRERMATYDALVDEVRASGLELDEVLHADATKLRHLAQQSGIAHETLQRFRALHREHFCDIGEKRKALVRAHGYDPRNAAHLIRLLRMGLELLTTSRLQVHRTVDADELKQIKSGAWTLAQVKDEAARLLGKVEHARSVSRLPQEPDEGAASALLLSIQRQVLGWPRT